MSAFENTVAITNLSKGFNTKTGYLPVFENMDFNVASGELLAILGPSGCGKSTMLRCIADLLPYNGRILIHGELPKSAAVKKNIGFVFQEAGLLPWKTVLENIMLPSQIGYEKMQNDKAISKAMVLLDLVRLTDYRNFLPAQLSGGMKQRTALARALMLNPELLLLDECFSALDSITRLKLMIEFRAIHEAKQTTTIMITHSVEEAAFLADRIIVLTARPAKIAFHSTISYSEKRDENILNSEEFINVTSKCRRQLFQYAE